MEQFDWQAKDWDNDPDKVQRAEVFAKEIKAFLKSNGKLKALEFGCGTGLLSFNLMNAFKSITLADSSAGMIDVLDEKIAKAQITNFKTVLGNLLENNIELERHDVIYTLMTLHHIPKLDKAFSKFNELLNQGGYLCIADLDKEDGSFHAGVENFDGHNGFDKNELIAQLANHGFSFQYHTICHEIITESEEGKRAYPLFLMICRKE